MKRCSQCDRFFDDSDDFCPDHGTRLTSSFGSGEAPTVEINRGYATPSSVSAAPSSNRWVFPLIGLLCGLVVVLGFFALYGNRGGESATNASAATPTPAPSATTNTMAPSPPPAPPAVARVPPGGAKYRGNIGGVPATFNLAWRNDQVTGNYFYDGSPGDVHVVSGNNQVDGRASATSEINGQIVGRMDLGKTMSSGSICWSGTFRPTAGGTSSISFCRNR